jgi:hypothetical protein
VDERLKLRHYRKMLVIFDNLKGRTARGDATFRRVYLSSTINVGALSMRATPASSCSCVSQGRISASPFG